MANFTQSESFETLDWLDELSDERSEAENDQEDEANADDLDEDYDENEDEDDEEDEDEYGTAWCPYCDAKIDFFGCSHAVYNYDATNCSFDDIDSDLMEAMVYLILENLPKYSDELSFFPSFEFDLDDDSEEDELDIFQRLITVRERTEEMDDYIHRIKEYISDLRYQDFDDILYSFHFENPDDYCTVEILDTDNRSYCDGRVFGMAKNPNIFEPGLVPLREKYGWLKVV